jgi:hypothetical protein
LVGRKLEGRKKVDQDSISEGKEKAECFTEAKSTYDFPGVLIF